MSTTPNPPAARVADGPPGASRAAAHEARQTRAPSLFRPGHNCCRVARAGRIALLVDADAYFRAFTRAAARAERSILILGWDFHSQTRLYRDPDVDGPELLGAFLNHLARRRRELHVRVIVWDYPMLYAKGRELPPIFGFGWRPHRRVHVCYDDRFPVGASHHQKLVVIDGKVGFCGGVDLTRSRWDTPEHRGCDPRRVNPGEREPYPPFHDVMAAVDGEAARALEEVARERWRRATGRALEPADAPGDPWPDLEPALRDVDVAVARTLPPCDGERGAREVQSLYLDMIAAARRSIYIENQYFTSHALGEALAARLREPDGPEIIAVLRLSTAGWLEASTMGTLRTELLARLKEADRYGRFRAYYPHLPDLPEGQCCDLHSKLIIVDDEYVQLGSANFCNRSLGLDTECNVALEACGEERIAAAIAGFRARLLAEHLDTTPEAVESATREHGSLAAAIDALAVRERTLRPYVHLEADPDLLVSIASVADPEQPVSLDRLIEEFAPESRVAATGPLRTTIVAIALGLAVLAAAWRLTPLSLLISAERVVEWARDFAAEPWAPYAMLASYTPAALLMFPRPLITLFGVVAFGPWLGFGLAYGGILLACLATYAIGLGLDRSAVRRLAGPRVNRLGELMRRRGLLAMTILRLTPIAPFVVVNFAAGAMRVRLRDFMGGSAIGILPGTLVATVFGEALAAALRDPRSVNFVLIAVLLALLALFGLSVRRWLVPIGLRNHGAGSPGGGP